MTRLGSGDYLAAAHVTATALANQAIWSGDRCTWIGAVVREGAFGQPIVDYATLGSSVYDGTAGVGCFLAEVAAATGDSSLRQSGLGAFRHAFAAAGEGPAALSPYLGALGTALAALRAATATRDEELDARARHELAHLLASTVDPEGFDLLSGAAGAVLGLLVAADAVACQRDRAVELAVRYADQLVASARVSDVGLSWPSQTIAATADLTGLSHGATGPGLALLELGRVTGEARYRDAGIRAFDYESSLFDTRHCNWPDLRAPRSTLGYAPPVDSSFTTFWCHGAPGMLTARLRVVDLLPERLVDETAAAVRSTAAAVRAMLDAHDNFSLCHGLAGNAEALLLAIARDRVSASTTATIAGLPALVAETGIERYVERGVDWPSGARRGRNPSLFLGAAGPGHLLLSLARPDTATALFPVIPGRRS